jgi:regulation of enolase protein 1 (concanavalin A-like superfamily)
LLRQAEHCDPSFQQSWGRTTVADTSDARQPDLLPMPLRWLREPVRWELDEERSLTIVAGPQSDWFVNPQGAEPRRNAPVLVGEARGDFMLSARVSVEFASTFDAGVLFLYAAESLWAKLCFEYSPQGTPMVVSVVTRGTSDDCNSVVVDANSVWLRIARMDSALAFHSSTDGSEWNFVRHFTLGPTESLSVGFAAQSPTGEGCEVTFDDIRYSPRRLGKLRSGE